MAIGYIKYENSRALEIDLELYPEGVIFVDWTTNTIAVQHSVPELDY